MTKKTSRGCYSFSLKGYLFFPVSLFAVIVTTRLSGGQIFLGYFLAALLMFKGIRARHQKLALIMLTSFIFGWIFSTILLQFQAQRQQLAEESGIYHLSIRPDTIKVDGNLLQAQGVYTQGKRKEKIQVYYSLQSEAEKSQWEQQVEPIELLVQATVQLPETQRNLHGFDYQKYLNRKNIYRIFELEQIKEMSNSNRKVYLNLTETIFTLRRKTEVAITQHFPKLTGIYLKSLLIGIKDADFKEQQQTWQKNGILHLFTLSGMHLFFFLVFFRYLLLRIGIIHEAVFGLEYLLLFFLFFFTGVTSSVGRCVLQTGASRSNRFFRWSFSDLDCWSLALFVNLLFQPTLLLEAGGQMTYALTFFLIFIRPAVQNIQSRVLQSFYFSFLLTLVTLPFLWYHFHEWYLLSFLFSWLLMPLFSRVILPSCCFLFAAFLLFPSWQGPSQLSEFFLEKFHSVLETSSGFSFSHFVTGQMPLLLFIGVISLLIGGLWLMEQKRYRWTVVVFVCFFLCSGFKYLDPQGKIAYIDVGQGDSIFIQLPFHRGNLLIDTGGRLNIPQEKWQERTYQASNASKTVIPFLKSCGVKQLDKMLVTHADADHMGDLLAVAAEVQITELIFPTGTTEKQSFLVMAQQLSEQGTKLTQVLSGDKINLQYQQFQVLSPFEKGQGENNDSMVVFTTFARQSFLFTGDLEGEGERQLIQRFPMLKIDILKAGHHGSQTSSTPEFVATIKPKITILSCGKNNRYGHPHDSVVDTYEKQGTKIYRTDEQGMIHFSWCGKNASKLQVTTIK